MIYPIVAFGTPVLKKKAVAISKDHAGLAEIIANMYETMKDANGVGLAAPQVGLSIRLFVTDGSSLDKPEVKDFRQVFINAVIETELGDDWPYNEGCLSIPGIREDVKRKEKISIRFFDEKFREHKKEYSGIAARIIQHEYDHIEGILFTDRLSPLRKRLLKNRLLEVSRGIVDVDYKMKFPNKK